ncbi:MAG: hypothetical protein QXL86_02590 [Candidatus Aenigmatarchaeota archaeon]
MAMELKILDEIENLVEKIKKYSLLGKRSIEFNVEGKCYKFILEDVKPDENGKLILIYRQEKPEVV